jgi:hypothetical protein
MDPGGEETLHGDRDGIITVQPHIQPHVLHVFRAPEVAASDVAIYAGMQRFGMVEDLRGTRLFTTARGTKVRKVVKPRRPVRVTLARVPSIEA